MPYFRNPVRHVRQPLLIALLWGISIYPCLSQTAGRVDGVQPGNVLALVSGVLQSHHHGLQKVEMDTHDLISNYEEFRAHFLPYRAHFRFHLEGNSLVVTMEDLESPGNGTWNRSLIPANAAEAKLIAKIVSELNAANRQLANSTTNLLPVRGPGPYVPNPDSTPVGVTPRLDLAKSLVFDAIPSVCAEGMCAIRKDGLWGFIDYHGNLVLDFQYHSATTPYFSRGTCIVGAVDSNNRATDGVVFIDKKGNVLFGTKVFREAHPFVDEVTTVTLFGAGNKGGSAVLDLQGHLLLSKYAAGEFHDGLMVANDPVAKAYGFRNAEMQWAVTPVYTQAQGFSEGIAWVETLTPGGASKWGAVNKEGKVIIPFQFSVMPEPFSEGLAVVSCSNGTFGYVDRTGKLAVPCQYREANRFVHGIAFVRPSSLFPMLIDQQGNIVADGKNLGLGLSELFRREDGLYAFLHTKIQTLTGLLDGNWSVLIPAMYESIGPFPAHGDPDGLAWATSDEMGKNPHQGFINRRGEYILLQQASMF